MDRPANIEWYQGAAIIFTSATGRKIPSLWRGKGDVEKRHQEVKQKASIQHQRHTREEYKEFLMSDNGFNSLGSPNIFHGLRYREWMHEVWESYEFYVQKMEEYSRDDPDATLCLEKDDVLRQAYYKYAREDGHHPESYRVLKVLYERHIEGKHVPFQRYVITPEEREEIENKESYRLILELLYKMHTDQNASTCFTI